MIFQTRKKYGGQLVEYNKYLNQLPDPSELIEKHRFDGNVPEVNGHLHSPWSFCPFNNINQMFEMAGQEKIKAIGINDFYTLDGYSDFGENAFRTGIFPLFNIEFMGLMQDLQSKDILVNDPNNPGRIYFSGKGLKHPAAIGENSRKFLGDLQENSLKQVKEMCQKTNAWLEEISAPFGLDYEEVKDKYAKELVRERHIARAIREAVFGYFDTDPKRKDFFEKLFGGKKIQASLNSIDEIENEIRSVLLKIGGKAFVPEDSAAFPDLSQIIDFILDAGGIPCYPVLLDDKNGNITAFEEDWERMHAIFQGFGVSCLELIPHRNSLEKLDEFVKFFVKKNYVISFGTEHNTPGIYPISVKVEKDRELTAELKKISYQGVCVIAAHQYFVARGKEGFIDGKGKAKLDNQDYFQDLGHAVIREFTISN